MHQSFALPHLAYSCHFSLCIHCAIAILVIGRNVGSSGLTLFALSTLFLMFF